MKKILLQCKFFCVAFLSCSYNFIPNPLRKWYLRLFGIKIAAKSSIHRGCRFFHVGNVSIGENSCINFGCYLDNRRKIIVGDNVGIAHNTKIYTLGHDVDSPTFETKGREVVIEDNVFVFSNVLIMPGVTIHEGAVVLPGAVVTKDVPARKVVGGNPARVIRDRNPNVICSQQYGYWFAL